MVTDSKIILMRHVLILLALLACVAAGSGYYMAERAFDPGPPMIVSKAEVLSQEVHKNDPVEILYTMNRNRRCPSLIIGFIVDPLTNEAVTRFDPVFGGYGPIGNGVKTLVKRPAPDKPGQFCYRSSITHWCGDNTYTTNDPDACFTVRE